MNRYMLIRRLQAPAYILLTGVLALLSEWHVLGWGRSWPLYLILAGILKLAERAALATADPEEFPGGYASYPAPTPGQPPMNPGSPAVQTTAIVPAVPENHTGESGR